jgi:hypothetical protein
MPDDLDRLVAEAIRDADDVSGRIVAGGYRANLSDTERLRNHVRRLAAALASTERPKGEEPHAAVGKFLSELYAVMVDPCAEGTITVAELKNELMAAALLQRERAHATPSNPETPADAQIEAMALEQKLRAEPFREGEVELITAVEAFRDRNEPDSERVLLDRLASAALKWRYGITVARAALATLTDKQGAGS